MNEIKEGDLRELVRKMLVKEPEGRLKAKDILEMVNGKKVQMSSQNETKVETALKNQIKINPLTNDARIDERKELQKISEK